ncbi:DinB family protein [Spirosoma soli]|uniref:DinB family protein n=1 Tax=Spirosoma soli TaxID=1770529 RepID=A0ABW5M1M8_9BACT
MTTTQTTTNLEQLQYPIGRFAPKEDYSIEEVNRMIGLQETAPARYQKLLAGRSDEDLARTYREGSWTVQQLVHHIADIQLLNFLRLKKALTEDDYVITLVQMNDWAKTPDATTAPIDDSLLMFDGITRRFVYLWRTLDEQTQTKTYYHPSRQINLSLKQFLYMATWHVVHHQGHIELALGLQPSAFLGDGLSR